MTSARAAELRAEIAEVRGYVDARLELIERRQEQLDSTAHDLARAIAGAAVEVLQQKKRPTTKPRQEGTTT